MGCDGDGDGIARLNNAGARPDEEPRGAARRRQSTEPPGTATLWHGWAKTRDATRRQRTALKSRELRRHGVAMTCYGKDGPDDARLWQGSD